MAVLETTARANAALDELYRQHVGDVYRYTYAVLGNHADAEDVTQTTFVNALRALERGETPEDPSRWLIVIAHNLVRQRWRQAAARPALVELQTDVPDGSDEDDAVELEELVRALQRIPETQREALVMRELEGRSYREIAVLLGLSTSALETLLFRARRSLADELENVVTCQNAELSISKRLDGRLSRKERRRLDEHLADCPDCARLAKTEARQRKAFKGLALLPLPIGLALFKGAPSAAAATSLPTIGLGSTGAGATGAGTGAAAGTASGGTVLGGSLAGGVAVKVAAVAAAAAVATGIGYEGVQALRDTPAKPVPAQAGPIAVRDSSKRPAGTVATRAKAARSAPAPARAARVVSRGKPSAGKAPARESSTQAVAPAQPGAQPGPSATESAGGTQAARGKSAAAAQETLTPGTAPKPKQPVTKQPVTKTPVTKTPTPAPKGPGSSTPGGVPPAASPPPVGSSPAGPAAGATPTRGADAASSPEPSAGTSGKATGDSSAGAPLSTTPGASPPASTPPSTPPTTPPASIPPAEQPPSGSDPGSSSGEPSGGPSDSSSGPSGPSSQAANPWEEGKKLGHHKGNHDDKHPGDS